MAQDFEHLKRAERALDRSFEHGIDRSDEMDLDHSGKDSGEDSDYEMAGDPRGGSGGIAGRFRGRRLPRFGGHGSPIAPLAQDEGQRASRRAVESPRPMLRPSRLTGQSGEGGVRRSYVRALPLKAEAAIPLEEVLTTYQKRAEESLLREEIPPNNRDLVRAYFLAIGLVEESAGSEGKDDQRER